MPPGQTGHQPKLARGRKNISERFRYMVIMQNESGICVGGETSRLRTKSFDDPFGFWPNLNGLVLEVQPTKTLKALDFFGALVGPGWWKKSQIVVNGNGNGNWYCTAQLCVHSNHIKWSWISHWISHSIPFHLSFITFFPTLGGARNGTTSFVPRRIPPNVRRDSDVCPWPHKRRGWVDLV